MIDHIGTVGKLKGIHHVLLDEQDRDAGFVDRSQARRRHRAAADRAHLLLAARQGAGILPLAFREDREHRIDAFEVRGDRCRFPMSVSGWWPPGSIRGGFQHKK